MAVNKLLFLNMTMLIMQKKYPSDQVLIISREMKDRIALLNCTEVQGAIRDGEHDKCRCQNAGSILSDERGKLKCYEKVDKPNCRMETIPIGSHTYHTIDVKKECSVRGVLNSAAWNINTTGEARGYWHYIEDMKIFLSFDAKGKLKVNVNKGLLTGLLLKLELLCSSTNMTKCVMIKIHGVRLYPLIQFNTSTIVPTPTTTATMKQPISKNSTNTQTNKSIKQKPASKNHNIIIVLLVASVTMLISSILLVYLWRQRKRKINLRENRPKRSPLQPLEPINLRPAFPEEKRHSTESSIYETFGAEYTKVAIVPSLKPGQHKAQYNELLPDYQEVEPVYTDLSTTNPTCSEKVSHGRPEKHEKKLFRYHVNIFRKKVSVTLNPSPKFEEKREYNELAESYRDAKPVYTDLSKDNTTFEEEHLYRELEEPKRDEPNRASTVIKKQASVAFNPPNKSDKLISQYSEIDPQYPDSLPVYANPNAVAGHVYRELEEPYKMDSSSSPSVIYDKPHCVVGNYCHRVRKLSSEVLNPKLIQARVLSDGGIVV